MFSMVMQIKPIEKLDDLKNNMKNIHTLDAILKGEQIKYLPDKEKYLRNVLTSYNSKNYDYNNLLPNNTPVTEQQVETLAYGLIKELQTTSDTYIKNDIDSDNSEILNNLDDQGTQSLILKYDPNAKYARNFYEHINQKDTSALKNDLAAYNERNGPSFMHKYIMMMNDEQIMEVAPRIMGIEYNSYIEANVSIPNNNKMQYDKGKALNILKKNTSNREDYIDIANTSLNRNAA